MKLKAAIDCLKALAQPNRLELYRLLVQAGSDGLVVGDLAARASLPGATLSNHLNSLRRAGLVGDERQGRTIRCRANYKRMNALLAFLTENCCADAVCTDVSRCPPPHRRIPL